MPRTRQARAVGSADGVLTAARLRELRQQFASDPAARVAQNAVTQVSIDDVALNRGVVTTMEHTFSHVLDDWEATNQKGSGRCWMFAGLNLFRAGAIKKMKVKTFEFSQNYILFWDKFERANHFLEAILQTADRDLDDRTVAYLLERPLDDGGQWNMFVNVVQKHGVCPKTAMPETESSSSTGRMNGNLLAKLREGARSLRELKAARRSDGALREAKDAILATVYRMLCIHLGTPPAQFVWQWMDKDRKFHRDGMMTPQSFARKYITIPLEEYVCLVHDPRKSSPLGRTYTVEFLGNVVGGEIVTYLNVDVTLMKRIAQKTLVAGEPVWFGCDTGKKMRRDKGLWDLELFDYAGIYGTRFDLNKADRLRYHETAMNHAMLFTGVDVLRGKARRWRVENSWGTENGEKGFFVMNDSWFDEHVFEVAARTRYLPPKLRRALARPPIVLPPWDPMGSLAG